MVPTNKIEELISKHSLLEKELSSGKTGKKSPQPPNNPEKNF
mgnify:CR=1 FL=1